MIVICQFLLLNIFAFVFWSDAVKGTNIHGGENILVQCSFNDYIVFLFIHINNFASNNYCVVVVIRDLSNLLIFFSM